MIHDARCDCSRCRSDIEQAPERCSVENCDAELGAPRDRGGCCATCADAVEAVEREERERGVEG